jgi:multiple sugar transport system substrate-binding protein
MGVELTFSVMIPALPVLQPLLDQFAAEQGITVRVRPLSWDTGWSDLTRVARTGSGPDLSEIGSTWLGDLIATQALRPFGLADVRQVGGASAFLPVAWQVGHPTGQAKTWAIPWLVGARLLYFRRRLLEAAGVSSATAFGTADQLDRTLGRLQAAGVELPWIVPTGTTHTSLLNAASWVWGAGGDFVTPDGKRLLFHEPAARAGWRAYFALRRYLAPAARHLRGEQPDQQFLHHPAAGVTISGHWLFMQAREQTPAVVADLGLAPPPGPSFVGGSYLVIWKHSPQPAAALALIRFLTQRAPQVAYSQVMGLLPVTQEALAGAPFVTDPAWQVVLRALQAGRTFPVIRTWGQIEYRLVAALSTPWAAILADPQLALEATLARHLTGLAERLEPLLQT